MPEYGRGIQNMVDVAVSIPERESRQRCAETIIAIMARIQQGQDQQPDFEQKLWNHLARMAHYKLDIDYPVEIVPEEQAFAHAAPLHYPMKHIRRKHYGYQVENALKVVQFLKSHPKVEKVNHPSLSTGKAKELYEKAVKDTEDDEKSIAVLRKEMSEAGL